MFTKHFTESAISERRFKRLILAFFSAAGSVIGVMAAYSADAFFLSLMRMAVCLPVSIVSLLVVILLPFLITAAVSFVEKPYLLLPLSFFKSLSYSLVFASTCITYSSAGWLVCGLMLFTDTMVNCLLHGYWLRHIDAFQKTAPNDLLCVLLLSLAIGVADFLIVSPYLTALINS